MIFFYSEQVVQQVFDELGLTLTDEVSSLEIMSYFVFRVI